MKDKFVRLANIHVHTLRCDHPGCVSSVVFKRIDKVIPEKWLVAAAQALKWLIVRKPSGRQFYCYDCRDRYSGRRP